MDFLLLKATWRMPGRPQTQLSLTMNMMKSMLRMPRRSGSWGSGSFILRSRLRMLSWSFVDGTLSRVCFRKHGGNHVREIRRANRDVPVPLRFNVKRLAGRVLKYFERSHQEVHWAEDARLAFHGFQAAGPARGLAREDLCPSTALPCCLGAEPLSSSNGCRWATPVGYDACLGLLAEHAC